MTQALGYTDATLNITTDIVFAILIPVPLFYNLNISTPRRIYLMTVLGLGVLACLACIMKTVHLYQMAEYTDFLWDSCYITIWVAVEVNVGIIAGSIPAVKPCVRALVGHRNSQHSRHKRLTPFSFVTTVGSHRCSWRILDTSGSELTTLGSLELDTSRTTSSDRTNVAQKADDEGVLSETSIRKSRPMSSRTAEDIGQII